MTDRKSSALLIDANSMIHRAWHTFVMQSFTAPDGRNVKAVYFFTNILLKALADLKPTHVVACWDTPEPTFRHIAEPAYKAQREEQPAEFYEQFDLVKEIIEALGIRNVELPGYEADDILGTLAVMFAAEGIDATILTNDRDAWQMIGKHIDVLMPKKPDAKRYDTAALIEEIGLRPDQVPDLKALMGDSSDNLKGVSGIGEVNATKLLQKFQDLAGVFAAAHDPKSDIPAGVRAKLIAGEQDGVKTLPLVRILIDAPLKLKDHDLERKPVDEEKLRAMFTDLGFKTMVDRVFGSKDKAQLKAKADVVVEKPVKAEKPVKVVRQASALKELDPSAFLRSLSAGDEVVIHAIETVQGSLFQDVPLFVMRSKDATCLITRSAFDVPDTHKILESVLADKSIKKIGHDLKRTWHACHKLGLDLAGLSFDTQIAAYLLSSGEGVYELSDLSAGVLSRPLSEGDDRSMQEASAIWDLATIYKKDLARDGLDTVLARLELPLIPVLGEMEDAGILIDKKYFKALSEEFRAERLRMEEEIVKLAGEPFNPASPAQLSKIMFEKLGIPSKGIKRTKTGLSTAASELEKLEGLHPIVEKISDFREVAKLLGTYVDALPLQADPKGRVHTTYNFTIAATGRLSSTDPNLQNIPIRTELGRKIRQGFVAPKGKVLLSCDYSQIELRIIAALAKDTRMLDAFNRNADIHTETAAAIWHVKADEVTKDQRRAAKAINFGIIYGQGPQGLAKAAGVPFAEAKAFIEEYFAAYSGIHAYLENTRALAHAQGYVETLFGRRRLIAEINSPMHQMRAAAERMAINMPVQGTAADIMKLGLIEVARHLPKLSPESRILLQVHDELVLEVPKDEVEEVAKAVIDWMAHVEKIGCPIVVEAKAGPNWDKMQPVT